MNETTILLAPSPGAQGDFLATVTAVASSSSSVSSSSADDLPFEIVLDNYTREAWASAGASDKSGLWKTVQLRSVDGRAKLPGFLKYLKDRKKAALGKFPSDSTEGLFVVPFDQPPTPPSNGSNEDSGPVMLCKYVLDRESIKRQQRPPNAVVKAPPGAGRVPSSGKVSAPKRGANAPPRTSAPPPSKSGGGGGIGGGLLGGLLGAQRRTDAHLAAVPKSSVRREASEDAAVGGDGGGGSGGSSTANVIAKFREDTCQKLLDFQKDPSQTVAKIKVSLAEIRKQIDPTNQAVQLSLKMDVLKYVVYEQAEEVDENWIAAKEPSEFMDECIVAVYKAGHAPAEVLEEMNKGDLPDEIKGQQQHMREAMAKGIAKKEAKRDALNMKRAVKEGVDAGLATLNTNKRDRRTIEEIQRGIIEENKRGRTS